MGGFGEDIADARAQLHRLRLIMPTPVATPPALEQATPFGDAGLKEVTIAAGETRLFRFQPESAVQIKLVGDLFLSFEMKTDAAIAPGSVRFYIWDETVGLWDDNNSHNELPSGSVIFGIQAKDEVVRANGVFHFSIENRGSTPAQFDRLSICRRVLSTAGLELNLGLIP